MQRVATIALALLCSWAIRGNADDVEWRSVGPPPLPRTKCLAIPPSPNHPHERIVTRPTTGIRPTAPPSAWIVEVLLDNDKTQPGTSQASTATSVMQAPVEPAEPATPEAPVTANRTTRASGDIPWVPAYFTDVHRGQSEDAIPLPPPRRISSETDERSVDVLPRPRPVAEPLASTNPETVPPAFHEAALHPGLIPVSGMMLQTRNERFFSPEITLVQENLLGLDPWLPNRQSRGYVRAEYLMWWMTDDEVPPLLTTSNPDPDPTPPFEGQLGRPDTVILVGGGFLDEGFRNGGRFSFGYWLDRCKPCGIDGNVFFLSPRTRNALFSGEQFPVLARPIFAPNLNSEFVELVSSPGLALGTARILADSRLWGGQINLLKELGCPCDCRRPQLFGGFRYLDLQEDLEVAEFILALEGAPDPPGTFVVVTDGFATRNQFYGGQVGGQLERQAGRMFVYLRGSVAFGVTHQVVEINGNQFRTKPGQPTESFVGGLLTTPSNIGRFDRDRFSVIPEVTLNVGMQLTRRLRAFVGYNVLYWPNVLRVGQQIDRVVDVALVPNPPVGLLPTGLNRPAVLMRESDLWVQGLNFGAEYRW